MKEEWLFPAALIPVDRETTHALVAEIKRLIDVVGGMALAHPEQEPVTCKHEWFRTGAMAINECRCIKCGTWNTVTPPKRPWIGLTNDELVQIGVATGLERAAAQMIESKLKEKNT